MTVLAELKVLARELGLSSGTVSFHEKAPDTYLVFTPLTDELTLFADNRPQMETEEVRISLFTKENYTAWKKRLTDSLLERNFVITERRFLDIDDETGYYHYSRDVAKEYVRKEE